MKALMHIESIGIVGATVGWVVGSAAEMPFLQYGALGVMAFAVFWLLTKTIPGFMVENRKQREDAIKALDQIGQAHAASLERIATTFRTEQIEARKMCEMHFDGLRADIRDTNQQLIEAMKQLSK
jgi:hypothetical protein